MSGEQQQQPDPQQQPPPVYTAAEIAEFKRQADELAALRQQAALVAQLQAPLPGHPGHAQQGAQRQMKLQPPDAFDPAKNKDPTSWLSTLDTYFDEFKTPALQRPTTFLNFLTPSTNVAFKTFVQTLPPPSWTDVKAAFIKRYDRVGTEAELESQLKSAAQKPGETVQMFIVRFSELCQHYNIRASVPWPDAFYARAFASALHPLLYQRDPHVLNTKTYPEAQTLALAAEEEVLRMEAAAVATHRGSAGYKSRATREMAKQPYTLFTRASSSSSSSDSAFSSCSTDASRSTRSRSPSPSDDESHADARNSKPSSSSSSSSRLKVTKKRKEPEPSSSDTYAAEVEEQGETIKELQRRLQELERKKNSAPKSPSAPNSPYRRQPNSKSPYKKKKFNIPSDSPVAFCTACGLRHKGGADECLGFVVCPNCKHPGHAGDFCDPEERKKLTQNQAMIERTKLNPKTTVQNYLKWRESRMAELKKLNLLK